MANDQDPSVQLDRLKMVENCLRCGLLAEFRIAFVPTNDEERCHGNAFHLAIRKASSGDSSGLASERNENLLKIHMVVYPTMPMDHLALVGRAFGNNCSLASTTLTILINDNIPGCEQTLISFMRGLTQTRFALYELAVSAKAETADYGPCLPFLPHIHATHLILCGSSGAIHDFCLNYHFVEPSTLETLILDRYRPHLHDVRFVNAVLSWVCRHCPSLRELFLANLIMFPETAHLLASALNQRRSLTKLYLFPIHTSDEAWQVLLGSFAVEEKRTMNLVLGKCTVLRSTTMLQNLVESNLLSAFLRASPESTHFLSKEWILWLLAAI